MTLLYMNSFGHYPTGYGLGGYLLGDDFQYAGGNPGTESIETGRQRFRWGGGTYSQYCSLLHGGDVTTIIVGFTLWSFYQISNPPILGFYDTISNQMLHFYRNGLGGLDIYRGGTLVLSSVGSMPLGGSAHWQIKVVFHNTDGEIYLYKDGALDSSITAIDTINAGTSCDMLVLFGPVHSGGGEWGISDLWVDDSAFLGELKCVYESCDTSGTNSDFTPTGDTTNEDCVDEYSSDEDSTYNVSGTTTNKDSMGHSQGTSLPGGVAGVQAHARARKEDANDGQLKLGVIQSTAEAQGSAKSLTTSYLNYLSIFLTDPLTASAWDPDDLDTAETSYEDVSVP